jgi:hypothetical protein
MGFGIMFALWSGALAAQALQQGTSYPELCKRYLLPMLKSSCSKRFFTSLLGSRAIRYLLNNATGKKSWSGGDLSAIIEHPLFVETFSQLYLLMRRAEYGSLGQRAEG